MTILINLPLPDSISVKFINACFEWLISSKSAIAIQALSMKMLLRICQKEPDFKSELISHLENIDYQNYSAGFICARKNVLKALKSKDIRIVEVK